MKNEVIKNTVSSEAFWMVNKKLARYVGENDAALLLADLISKREYFRNRKELDDDGGFFNIGETIEQDLNISKKQRQRLTNLIVKKGLIKVIKKGLPSKNYYYIRDEAIFAVLGNENGVDKSELKGTVQWGRKGAHLRGRKGAANNNKLNNNKLTINNQKSESECLSFSISLKEPKENSSRLVQNDQPTTYHGYSLKNKADSATPLPNSPSLVKKTNSIKDIEQTIQSFLVKNPKYTNLINALVFINQNDKSISHDPRYPNPSVWAIDKLVDILNGKNLTPKQIDNVWRIYDKNLEYQEKKKTGEFYKKNKQEEDDEIVELKNPLDRSIFGEIPPSNDIVDEEFIKLLESVDSSPD